MRSAILFLFVVGSTSLAAQDATPYVRFDHWTLVYLEHLIDAGVIHDPDPLTRPLTQAAIHRALEDADLANADPETRELVERLKYEMAPRTRRPTYFFDGYLGLRAGSHARRDLLRPAGDGGVTPSGRYDAAIAMGNALISTSGMADWRYRDDPDYGGSLSNTAPVRVTGYLAYQFEHGELFFGTLERNWGPSVEQGLMVSDGPYSYDHFSLKLGTDIVRLEMLATVLNNMRDSVTNEPFNRYLMAHRLVVRPSKDLTLAFSESAMLYGPNRRFEMWYLNPLRLAWTTGDDVRDEFKVNLMLGMDAEYRIRPSVTGFFSFVLDDFAEGEGCRCRDGVPEPNSFGLTLGGRFAPTPRVGIRAYYTMVSSLMYRSSSFLAADVHARLGVGLGRNFSDYDQFTVEATLLPHHTTVLKPWVSLVRQGEGDFRIPFPPTTAWPTWPTVHQGTVENALTFGLSGITTLNSRGVFRFDAGFRSVSDFGHVAGASDREFVGSFSVQIFGDERDFWWWLPTNW